MKNVKANGPELVGIQLWCNTHSCPLEGSGSGKVFYPTDTRWYKDAKGDTRVLPDNVPNKNGVLLFDTSEYCCPHSEEEFEKDEDYEGCETVCVGVLGDEAPEESFQSAIE